MYLEDKYKKALGTITKGQDKSSKLISYTIKKNQKLGALFGPNNINHGKYRIDYKSLDLLNWAEL